jgi:hypothetical protein
MVLAGIGGFHSAQLIPTSNITTVMLSSHVRPLGRSSSWVTIPSYPLVQLLRHHSFLKKPPQWSSASAQLAALYRHSGPRDVETCRGLLQRTCHSLLHQSSNLCTTGMLHTDELHTPTSLHSSKQQGDVTLKPHAASVCLKCFKCFIGMLQVFYIDIVKVDRDVAQVTMCFKRMFQMFHMF